MEGKTEKSNPGLKKKTKYVIESAMSHKMLILKAGIDFVLGSSPPPSENQFNNGIDSHKEPIPGAHKSLNIRARTCTAIPLVAEFINP